MSENKVALVVCLAHNTKAAVVVEGRSDLEAVTGAEVPRLACVDLVVDENLAAKWAKRYGIEVVRVIEICPSGDRKV